jgi:hypothetical protein
LLAVFSLFLPVLWVLTSFPSAVVWMRWKKVSFKEANTLLLLMTGH